MIKGNKNKDLNNYLALILGKFGLKKTSYKWANNAKYNEMEKNIVGVVVNVIVVFVVNVLVVVDECSRDSLRVRVYKVGVLDGFMSISHIVYI